ncbi:MAG: hypothetical protein ACI884_002509, partial [Ulvibacter sp.]
VLGSYKNSKGQNFIGFLIVIATAVLGTISLLKVFKVL